MIELGCSNSANPSGLPNDFARDPVLKQVVSRIVEAVARGSLADQTVNWSLDVFLTVNNNEIQFIATTTSNGYFGNDGTTRSLSR